MMAVIRVESAGDPFRIGVNKGGALRRQPGNAADAIATAKGLMRRGASFDAGLMQINSANFARMGLTPETVFDPCTTLRAWAHRSDERRVGKECVSSCRSRGSPCH